jgi:hypothetical protein
MEVLMPINYYEEFLKLGPIKRIIMEDKVYHAYKCYQKNSGNFNPDDPTCEPFPEWGHTEEIVNL